MIKRGDVYYADLSPVIGSEQGGVRPVVVVKNDKGNRYSKTIIIAPISKKMSKPPIPTHVIFSDDSIKQIRSRTPNLNQSTSVPPFLKFDILADTVHLHIRIIRTAMTLATFQFLKHLSSLFRLIR